MSQTYGRCQVDQPGPPDAMRWVTEPVRRPGAGEVRIRHQAIGVDFIDTQLRSGQLPATLPTGLGFAAVGVAEEVGPSVQHVRCGDRVACVHFVAGSYAEQRVVPADRVVVLPDPSLAPEIAAGALFRGLTAWYLVQRLREVRRGDVVLAHAAAGGVGLILSQWLGHAGATVVGTVGSEAKAEVARAYGCPHVVVIPQHDFVAKVREVSGGVGAAIVYDGVDQSTFAGSLDNARRFGLVVSYGWPSGDPDLSLTVLRAKGSLFVTRPTVTHYTAEANALRESVAALFNLVREGHLRIKVDHTYPLREAARAHQDLVAGRTTGSLVLIP